VAPVPRKYILLLVVALSVITLDQWTKYTVVSDLTTRFDGLGSTGERLQAMYGEPPPVGIDGRHFRPKRSVELLSAYLRLRYEENPGAAWGMFRNLPPNLRGPLFHLVSIGAVVLISYYFSKLSGTNPAEKWALWGLSLVLGGALGNYVDRLARGFVVDFIQAHSRRSEPIRLLARLHPGRPPCSRSSSAPRSSPSRRSSCCTP
jgi:signal peptidase II